MATDRGVGRAENDHKKPPSGKNFFVGIGIDAYTDAHFTPLSNAKKDTARVAEILVQKYGFEDRKDLLLLDEQATGSAIIACFRSLIDFFKKEPDTHNLVVYFAGHGDFDEDSDIGFRIPADGRYKDEKTFIEDSAILNRLKAIKAKHTLLIVDSCFSGSLVRSIESDEYVFEEQAELLTSRHIMTAGLLQTVSDGQRNDHSPFAKTMIHYLETSPKTLLPFSEVALHVKRTVPRNAKGQIPYFGHLQDTGDQGGEFVLRPKEVINPEIADWAAALETNTLEGFKKFKNKYPDSKNLKEVEEKEHNVIWNTVKQKNRAQAYLDFWQNYPKSKYRIEARQLLEIAEDNELWAKTPKTRSGMLNYLETFENGLHSDEAHKILNPTKAEPKPTPVVKQEPKPIVKENPKIEPSANLDNRTVFQKWNIPIGIASVVVTFFLIWKIFMDRNQTPPISNDQNKIENSINSQTTPSVSELEMVEVAGGTFKMGSNESDNKKPIHSVTLNTFYIGKTEVTQKQWRDVMGTNPSNFKGDDLPVENVSWDDVQEYLKMLNGETGKNYRLPTEAEWEYAARGGNQSKGYTYSGSNDLKSVAWFTYNSDSKTHPVGTKKANELIIHDMSGNVWEWCSDWYDENYYKNSPAQNPKGAQSGSGRVLRGGSWNNDDNVCRSANRDGVVPSIRILDLGFRLARD